MKIRILSVVFSMIFAFSFALGQDNTTKGPVFHRSCCEPAGDGGYFPLHPGTIEACDLCRGFGAPGSGKSTTQESAIVSPDGKPILYPRQVSFSLLNWGVNFNQFQSNGMVGFPGSSDFQVQSALTRITPQASWEQFGSEFQVAYHIRNLDNRILFQNQEYQNTWSRPVTEINYPTPVTASPDVWLVNISVKPEQVRDTVRSGISLRRNIISWLVGLGGVYLLPEQNNVGGRLGGLAAINLAQDIAAYRGLEQVTAMKFGVTVQFQHAQSGDILTFKGISRSLFPIFRSSFVLFYNNVTGGTEWMSWDAAMEEAFQQVRVLFDRDWRKVHVSTRQTEIAGEIRDLEGRIATESAELEAERRKGELTRRLLELLSERERLQKEKARERVEEPAPKPKSPRN